MSGQFMDDSLAYWLCSSGDDADEAILSIMSVKGSTFAVSLAISDIQACRLIDKARNAGSQSPAVRSSWWCQCRQTLRPARNLHLVHLVPISNASHGFLHLPW